MLKGTWNLGYSYSAGDVVKHNNAFYKAMYDIPCYNNEPDKSELWKLVSHVKHKVKDNEDW